jgi:cardiolipin synthase
VASLPPVRVPGDDYCFHPEAVRAGHKVDLLVDGEAAYPAMLEAIAAARREICLETYILEDDQAGDRFADALVAKAHQGVLVRMIVDAIGSFGLGDAFRRRLSDAGVKLAEFHPVAPWRRRWGWSVRDHRKLLVVDGQVAFAGGLNLADPYAPRSWGGGAWHDVHVRVEGPVARDLHKLFLGTWRYASDDPTPTGPARGTPAAIGASRVQVLASGSRRTRRHIRRHFHHAMRQARDRIYIQAAYFIPERGLRRVLRNAARRGVDVRLMLPAVSDIPAVQMAGRATYAELLRAGIRIFEWLPSVLHAKTIVVDGIWSAIGSYNLDRRSLVYNWELVIVVVDEATGGALERRFEDDLASCRAVDPEKWSTRSWWQRLMERCFYMLRRWL